MGTWDIKLQHLQDYGTDVVQDGQTFAGHAGETVDDLVALTGAISADPAFTELHALKDAVTGHAHELGGFHGVMSESIQSHGQFAHLSHEKYSGTDTSSASGLETSLQQIIDQHTMS